MKNPKPLRILIIEDVPTDAELVVRELKKGGLKFTSKLVDNEKALRKELDDFSPDLILSDYSMPQFTGLDALKIVLELQPEIPFILVTGTLSEETAVDCIKAGAWDYVIKDRLSRLVTAVNEAINLKIAREDRKRIREELRFSQEYSQYLINSSLDMIIAVDNNRKLTEFNKAAEIAFGYQRKEVVGKHVNILYANVKKGLNVHKQTEINGQYVEEVVNKRKNGTVFPALISASVLKDADGKQAGVMGISRDITVQNKAKDALIKSEERFKIIFYDAPDAIYLTDLKGNFIDGNKMAETLTGFKKESLIGNNFLEIGLLSANQIPKATKALAKSILGKATGPDEFTLNQKDGSLVDVEIITYPVKIQDQSLVLGIARDMSERMQAENKLRQSEERYRSVTETAAEAIISAGSNGRVVSWNPGASKLFGYSETEMLGKMLTQIIPEKYQKKHASAFKRFVETRKPMVVSAFEMEGLRKDGSLCPIEISLSSWEIGDEIFFTAIIRDIAKRRQMEEESEQAFEEARKANQVKDLFLANMSHEIRTPLNSILGFSQIIEQRFKDQMNAEDSEYFRIIHNSGERLINTVHGILDISQIEAGAMPYNPEPIILAASMGWMFKEFKPVAAVKNLELSYDNQIGNGAIKIDEASFRKAVSNLLDNAIKYTEKGRISITLTEEKGKYVLSISDTGIGISPEYQDHLYDAFSQESSGYTKKYQGLGLGLSITKRCLEINSVPIELESKQGVGTTFRLTFTPVAAIIEETEIKTRPAEAVVEKTASKEKPVILLVEDDENNRKTFEVILKKKFETPYAVSVNEAKIQLRKLEVDLIILDLSLEGDEDGLDLVEYMKKQKAFKDIPIIAVTAHAFVTDRENVLNAGCNDYLSKPVPIKKLLDKVGQYLN